ncbi:O-antigen ligase family protein [Natranaerobius thermophilus]|uniref:O-antigen polymerase n=1 Tax=Natranaerobius thermophilus (strain ATCC BAA-1301 / DSM 18059 / JW/NM-WN-LF) TaxID=457570 RepID=B2A0R9_NATTJ|nr:O-antigen ligase family protein [Natranaerobius thermophilus]ACB85949.1 O-antigen polymerase [Natranaerobius thermophilus JW/NM-WN-LF]
MNGKSTSYQLLNNERGEQVRSLIFTGLSILLIIVSLFSLFDFFFRNFGLPTPLARGWNDALMLAGFFMLVYLYKSRWLSAYHKTETDMPYVVLMAFAAITIIVNGIPPIVGIDGLRVLGQVVFWYLIVFYALKNVGDSKFLQELVTYMLIAAAIVALYGVLQYIFAFETPANWIDRDMENIRTRVFSTIGNPNALGAYMAMFIPVSLSLGLRRKLSLKWRIVYLAIVLVMGLTLLFTFSRGAWIGCMAGVGLLMVMKDKRFIILFMILLVLMPVVLPDTITSRLFHAFSPEYIERSSEAGRLFYWRQAFVRMIDNPVFGTGLGSFGDTVAMRHDMPGAVWVDNHYLKTGAEMGIVGLGIFLWLMASVFLKGYRNLKRLSDPYSKELTRGILAGLFAVLIQNGTASIFEVLVVGTYFWILVGVLHALPLLYEREGQA